MDASWTCEAAALCTNIVEAQERPSEQRQHKCINELLMPASTQSG
jgi:hypothetical protein